MANSLSMADLLAKQDKQVVRLSRNQEVTGEIIAITGTEVILELGAKSEGTLSKRDLTSDELAELKIGKKLTAYVLTTENESGQVVLSMSHHTGRNVTYPARWKRFEDALRTHQTLSGKAIEVNKGGVIIEASGIRGFLPSSQATLSSVSNLENLIGKDVQVNVIEVDPGQNRLIFSQKVVIPDEIKQKLSQIKDGEQLKAKVLAILPFGLFVSLIEELYQGVEGLIHVSELSWERSEDELKNYQVDQEIETQVLSVDSEAGRVNLSIKQLQEDPFTAVAEKYQTDDVVRGEITKVDSSGVSIVLDDGLEGVLPANKMDASTSYEVGEELTVLIDAIDLSRRRVTFAPFLTSTEGLIYK